MRRLFLLCGLVPLTALAGEHWIRFTSGPIEVFSSAGSKDGRETLVKFEHALRSDKSTNPKRRQIAALQRTNFLG